MTESIEFINARPAEAEAVDRLANGGKWMPISHWVTLRTHLKCGGFSD